MEELDSHGREDDWVVIPSSCTVVDAPFGHPSSKLPGSVQANIREENVRPGFEDFAAKFARKDLGCVSALGRNYRWRCRRTSLETFPKGELPTGAVAVG